LSHFPRARPSQAPSSTAIFRHFQNHNSFHTKSFRIAPRPIGTCPAFCIASKKLRGSAYKQAPPRNSLTTPQHLNTLKTL
jgi:hypothetical protein